MNWSQELSLVAGLLLVTGCQSLPEKSEAVVSGETSGTLSRLLLNSSEKSDLEAGASEYFRKNAGGPPPASASGAQQGDLATSDIFLSNYQRYGEPRSMRGLTEDLVILPYKARIGSAAGTGEYRSYFIATRPKGGGRWKYQDGFSEPEILYRRFPGLKETNAIPPVRINMSGSHPALRKGA